MPDMLLKLFANIALAEGVGTTLSYKFPGQEQFVSGPAEYINLIFKFGLGIVGLIALGLIVFGGIEYIAYAGNPSKLAEAKDRVVSAFIGMILLTSAYILLREINPKLVELKNPELRNIKPELAIDIARIKSIENAFAAAGASTGKLLSVYAQMKEGKNEKGEVVDTTKQTIENFRANLPKLSTEQRLALFRGLDDAGKAGLLYTFASNYLPATDLIGKLSDQELTALLNDSRLQKQFGSGETLREFVFTSASPQQLGTLYTYYGDNGGAQRQYYFLQETSEGALRDLYLGEKDAGTLPQFFKSVVQDIPKISGDSAQPKRIIASIWRQLPESERVQFLRQVAKGAGYKFFDADTRLDESFLGADYWTFLDDLKKL